MLYTAKEVNKDLMEKIEKKIDFLKDKNISPKILTIRVGENGASKAYSRGLNKKIVALNIDIENEVFDENISEEELSNYILRKNQDKHIHGILIFQPLPKKFDQNKIINLLDPIKDLDGSTDLNYGRLLRGDKEAIYPCAPEAVMTILDHYKIEIEGKDVVVIGAGLLVGRPLSMLLSDRNASVSLLNVFTKELKSYTKKADIIISATGVKGLVDDNLVSKGQILIDVGIKFIDGKVYGDLDREKIEPIVKAFTPTPGGTGDITNIILARHLIKSCYKINDLEYID